MEHRAAKWRLKSPLAMHMVALNIWITVLVLVM